MLRVARHVAWPGAAAPEAGGGRGRCAGSLVAWRGRLPVRLWSGARGAGASAGGARRPGHATRACSTRHSCQPFQPAAGCRGGSGGADPPADILCPQRLPVPEPIAVLARAVHRSPFIHHRTDPMNLPSRSLCVCLALLCTSCASPPAASPAPLRIAAPANASAPGALGKTVVRGLVDGSGRVTRVEVVEPSGNPALDAAAEAALRRATFKPLTQAGTPVPAWVVLPVIFEADAVPPP